MWRDPGTWMALGVSTLFLVSGFVMHRVFVNILKNDPGALPAPAAGQNQPPLAPNPPQSHE